MYPSTFSPQRIVSSLAAVIALGGCADSFSPARSVSPSSIIIIGGHPIVFNAQLRFIGNPDVKPPIAVEGHLQLKLYQTDDGLVVDFKADIVNPECEGSNSFGGGIYAVQDSEDFPTPEDQALIYLLSVEKALGCGDNFLEGSVGISEELAARLVEDPQYFTAVFFLEGGGALAGTLQLAGSDLTQTR